MYKIPNPKGNVFARGQPRSSDSQPPTDRVHPMEAQRGARGPTARGQISAARHRVQAPRQRDPAPAHRDAAARGQFPAPRHRGQASRHRNPAPAPDAAGRGSRGSLRAVEQPARLHGHRPRHQDTGG